MMKFVHLGVAVHDIDQAIPIFTDLFGYSLFKKPIVDPVQKVMVCFLMTNNSSTPEIELVSPIDDESPINKILSKEIGAYHMYFEVENIDSVLIEARTKGCIIVSTPVEATAFEGRRIAWFYTPTHQLIEVLENGTRQ